MSQVITPNALSSKAVLIRLSASSFIGNPRDNTLTQEVRDNHGITEDRVSTRKKIMKSKELQETITAIAAVRLTVDALSAPWLDGGIRIIPAKSVVKAKVKIDEKIRDFYAKVDALVAAYDAIIENDKKVLNGTFREEDYPSKSELLGRFRATLEFMPVPNDFRVEGIDESTLEQLQNDAELLLSERIITAKREIVGRVREKISHLITRLKGLHTEEAGRFHSSNISNVILACEALRDANFDGDELLDKLADTIQTAITPISAAGVKDNEAQCDEAQEIANKALAQVEETLKAFVL